MKTHNLPNVGARQLAAILAGLRLLQRYSERGDVTAQLMLAPVWDVLTNAGTDTPLTERGIDALCDKLNAGRPIGAALADQTQAIVHGRYDTPHFRFDAYGLSQTEVQELLASAWRLHCVQTGADPDYFDGTGINYITTQLGAAWRDGDQLGAPSYTIQPNHRLYRGEAAAPGAL